MTSVYIARDRIAITEIAQISSTISSTLSFTVVSILNSQQRHGRKQIIEYRKHGTCTKQHHYDLNSRFCRMFHQLMISWDKIKDTKNIYIQGTLIMIIVSVSAVKSSLR